MNYLTLFYTFGLSLLLTGCLEDTCEQTVTYQVYEPVYTTAGEWRTAALDVTEPPTEGACDPSGFYIYGDYLFMVDRKQGIHIYDNRDNDNPLPVSFISMEGGQGIAARAGVLYVNQYTDLLAFSLNDPAAPQLLSRTEDVFAPTEVFMQYGQLTTATGEPQFVVDYLPTNETMTLDCNDANGGWGRPVLWMETRALINTAAFSSGAAAFDVNTAAPVGLGGSLARFTINEGNLYVVEDRALHAFSLADPLQPVKTATKKMDWGIETIFPYEDKLFIGSVSAMHIYGLDNPLDPNHLGTVSHVRSCDPVVVHNDIAYVTLWGGSTCGAQQDRLMTFDVSDPRSPKLLQEIPMANSHGLGTDGERLFVTAGPDGINVYDIADDGRLGEQLQQVEGFDAKDIIVRADRAELIAFGWGGAGIRQYDYRASGTQVDVSAVSELSTCHE